MDRPPKNTDTFGHRMALASPARRGPGANLDAGHVLGEVLVLLADVEGQLPRVAHDQDGHLGAGRRSSRPRPRPQFPGPAQSPAASAHLSVDQRNLLQRGQHEHCPLDHAGLGLAQDVHTQDALGDALGLDCGWEGGPARGAWRPCRQRAWVGAGAARASFPRTGARSHSPRGCAGAHACPPGFPRARPVGVGTPSSSH